MVNLQSCVFPWCLGVHWPGFRFDSGENWHYLGEKTKKKWRPMGPWTTRGQPVERTLQTVERTLQTMERTLQNVDRGIKKLIRNGPKTSLGLKAAWVFTVFSLKPIQTYRQVYQDLEVFATTKKTWHTPPGVGWSHVKVQAGRQEACRKGSSFACPSNLGANTGGFPGDSTWYPAWPLSRFPPSKWTQSNNI